MKAILRLVSALAIVFPVLHIAALGNDELSPRSVDVLVYGGTPAGIASAIAASREGASVLLVEPTRHVGGMATSGLSHPDFRTFEGITGAFNDFRNRIEPFYREEYGEDSQQFRDCLRGTHGEPHVNERIFEQMLSGASGVSVAKGSTLTDLKASDQEGDRRAITEVSFQSLDDASPLRVSARIVIDASYEGDLMALAGVESRVGREGRDEYGESLAPDEPDDQLQGYNFRMVMTQDPANRVEVQKPEGYRRKDFEGVLPLFEDGRLQKVFDFPSRCVFKAHIPVLPNGKYDINDVSGGAVRLSMPGENLGWPEGDAETRSEIFNHHMRYHVGLLWFLQHDEAIPQHLRDEARSWGWCRDEFTDNDHLPWQLYVREARRMVGVRVFTEADTDPAPDDARSVFQHDAIALGDYGPNCHGTAHEGPRFGGRHIGEFYKGVAPYQIPYGVLLPQEINNLLVPGAVSASHVGFCALRLEPIWMSLGQAAGVAAQVSLDEDRPLHDLPVDRLQRRLHAEGAATIYVSDVLPGDPLFAAVQWLGSQGGLHGLAPPGDRPGERGKNIQGQYFEAFPGHAFEPDQPMDEELLKRWLTLIPEPHRDLALDHRQTRGEVAARLFELAH
ncbi:FAD-dependent oxidoreductase [soil metagenome]